MFRLQGGGRIAVFFPDSCAKRLSMYLFFQAVLIENRLPDFTSFRPQ